MKREYIVPCVLLILVAGIVTGVFLHGTNIPVLQPAGPVALAERWVIVVTLLLSGIIVIPVFCILFLFAWKYRASSPQAHTQHRPDWDHDSVAGEFIWWLVPTLIIMVLAVIAWQTSHSLDPYRPLQGSGAPITVEVVALDWKWLFIYPEQGIATVNILEFPENADVHFELTADAPMNSFWIPQLGGQIMVMPGMQTQLNLMASRTGDFNGLSGNISGEGFSGMTFTAKAVTESDFESWVKSVKKSPNPLNASAYALLSAPSEYNPVAYYAPVDNDLYTSVIMKFMLPGQMNANMNMTDTMPMNTDSMQQQ